MKEDFGSLQMRAEFPFRADLSHHPAYMASIF